VNTSRLDVILRKGVLLFAGILASGSVLAATPVAPLAPTATKCRSELSPEALDRTAGRGSEVPPVAEIGSPQDPNQVLQSVARQALNQSAAVGASRWLADAASFDLEQTEAGRWPSVVASASRGPQQTSLNGERTSGGSAAVLSLAAGGSIYDGGRLRDQIQWRKDLLRAEQLGLQQAGEAVVSEAVSTVLERARYQMQAQVYQQYVRKMSCLVDALESIVSADRGRASELVQARKTLGQAELSRDIAVSVGRQIDHKLRKLLGESYVVQGNFTSLLSTPPDLGEMLRLMDQAADLQQAKAQADAAESYARALKSGKGPQLGWSASRTQTRLSGDNIGSWQATVSLSMNLFDGGAERAAIQSALARSESSRQQVLELQAARTERVNTLHDASTTAFRHAKRYVDILRDSELVRSYTFQQWSQLGRRSLFDLMSAESDHFNVRVSYVNSLFDGYEANAQLRSLAGGIKPWILGNDQP
jgi:adhesin transport system outer membrane protein